MLELLTSVGLDGDVDAANLQTFTYQTLRLVQSDDDNDVYALARTYFDGREFQRCAHFLDSNYSNDGSAEQRQQSGASAAASPAHYPPRAYFLRCYALYLDGQRRKEIERAEGGDGLTTRKRPVNPVLQSLLVDLESAYRSGAEQLEGRKGGDAGEGQQACGLDAFGLYIYGVALKESGRTQAAAKVLLQCVHSFPLLWSAWVDLAACASSRADVASLQLPDHWMSQFFLGHAYVELQANTAALKIYAPLSAAFPRSTYLQAQVARAVYGLQRYDKAQALFETVRSADPFRVEDTDTYSNILFVKGDRAALSVLAHHVHGLDRFKPQTCCVVGNYHAMRGEHEAAILAFRKAVHLEPTYVEAWTLMGHEYVELKNTSAAIECYRRAVDTNGGDYRAWYGLGQTYELLSMYLYAIHYYKQAAALRPYDARMWCALGACYERLERRGDAVAAYERAARHADREGVATIKLAKLYRDSGDVDTACQWYAQHVEDRESAGLPATPDVAEALLYLAIAAKDDGRLDEAEAFATRVLSMPMPSEVRDARAVLAEVRVLKMKRQPGSNVAAATGAHAAATMRGQSPGNLAAQIAAAARAAENVSSTPAASNSRIASSTSGFRSASMGPASVAAAQASAGAVRAASSGGVRASTRAQSRWAVSTPGISSPDTGPAAAVGAGLGSDSMLDVHQMSSISMASSVGGGGVAGRGGRGGAHATPIATPAVGAARRTGVPASAIAMTGIRTAGSGGGARLEEARDMSMAVLSPQQYQFQFDDAEAEMDFGGEDMATAEEEEFGGDSFEVDFNDM